MAEELYSFEKVLEILQVDEAELKRLIAQGELRAHNVGGVLKFVRKDVDTLKESMESEPTILLTDSDAEIAGPAKDELLVEEMASEGETVVSEEAFETEEIPTIVRAEPEDEEIILEKTEAIEIEPEETDEGAATLIDVGVPAVAPPSRRRREPATRVKEYETVAATRPGTGRISRSARLRILQMKRKKGHLPWTIILLVTSIFVILPSIFVFNTIRNVEPKYAKDIGEKCRGIADWFYSLGGE